jgi:hypothetical protein
MNTTLEKAENAVAQLSAAELAAFRQSFAEFDGDAWDVQIESDAAAGKLDSLIAEAQKEYRAGRALRAFILMTCLQHSYSLNELRRFSVLSLSFQYTHQVSPDGRVIYASRFFLPHL